MRKGNFVTLIYVKERCSPYGNIDMIFSVWAM